MTSETTSDTSQVDVSQLKFTKFRAVRYSASRFTCEITVAIGEESYVLTVPVYEMTAQVVMKSARKWRDRPGNKERVLAAIQAGLQQVPANTAN